MIQWRSSVNVVLKLFASQSGRHSPAEALAGLGPRVAKSGRFPFLSFLLSPGNVPARFIAGADNGFTLAPRFARTTMHKTNTTPLTAEETRPGRNSNDTDFYLLGRMFFFQNILSSNYEKLHTTLDF